MLKVLRALLAQGISDIDSNNSNISEEELLQIINLFLKVYSKELSKIESANYIGVSRATFDNYVKKGLLPKGKKRPGFNELSWDKQELNNFINKNN